MIKKIFYDHWDAYSIRNRLFNITLIIQHPTEWEWKPRKCYIWAVDNPDRSWIGYHLGPFEITWNTFKKS